MGRKSTFAVSFVGGYAVARHMNKQAAAEAAAEEAAWERAYAEMQREQAAAQEASAAAARDEIRHQAALTRRATWMSQDAVGQAWRDATAQGAADARLAQHIEATNVAWRQAWTRQCDADGLGPVKPRRVGGLWLIDALRWVVLPLVGIALLLFAASAVAWLWNHSPFTPEMQAVYLDEETGERAQVPRRGTREFWTPSLAIWAYVAGGVAVVAYLVGSLLSWRWGRAVRQRHAEAAATNEARAGQRAQRYGFDPLAARLPGEAHWAVLPDGSDPEQALVLLSVVDARQMQEPERMTMAHVERLRAVAEWGGRARPDTPVALPPGMVTELERLRGRYAARQRGESRPAPVPLDLRK